MNHRDLESGTWARDWDRNQGALTVKQGPNGA
jgi:hypothetical protein